MGIKHRLARLLGIRQMVDAQELGRYVQEWLRAGLSRSSSLPGTQSLASVMNEPQAPVQSLCADPLPPRAERCPEEECRAGGSCWRCDYEESSHRCYDKDGRTC